MQSSLLLRKLGAFCAESLLAYSIQDTLCADTLPASGTDGATIRVFASHTSLAAVLPECASDLFLFFLLEAEQLCAESSNIRHTIRTQSFQDCSYPDSSSGTEPRALSAPHWHCVPGRCVRCDTGAGTACTRRVCVGWCT